MNYKKSIFFAICAVTVGGVSYGAGLLQATKFPATFQDLSFKTRMDVLADGYDGVSEYDENGRCVSGCAYYGITLAEEERMIADATRRLQYALEQEEQSQGRPGDGASEDQSSDPTPPNTPPERPAPTPAPTPRSDNGCGVERTGSGYYQALCPPMRRDLIVTSDFSDRYVGNGTRYHRGVDLRAADGTDVYAVRDGKVTLVRENSPTAGNYIEIEHNLQFENQKLKSRYLHLSQIGVRQGATVHKGQKIGKSGYTPYTDPKRAHLHFDIALGGVMVDPLASKIKPILENGTESQKAYTYNKSNGKNFIGNVYRFKPGVFTQGEVFGSSHRAKDEGCSCSGNGLQKLKDNYPGCQGCSDW